MLLPEVYCGVFCFRTENSVILLGLLRFCFPNRHFREDFVDTAR